YSQNVVDLCPVGALQSRAFLYSSRVWYLQSTPSVCPSCERGCNIDIWHRREEWKLRSVNVAANSAIARVTPRENAAVNGPWMCDTGRDLGALLDRPRATQAMIEGKSVTLETAIEAARKRIAASHAPIALVSNWGSNEELRAFAEALAQRCTVLIKIDRHAHPGEVISDDLLIRADKNPNTAGARAVFPDAKLWSPHGSDARLPHGHDLVLAWGEGFEVTSLPSREPVILLGSYESEQNARAAVFIPISIQTERRGHYTNFAGQLNAFEPCFKPRAGVIDAEALFPALANARVEATA
ncbi:MAG TPA: NADH-quinone oxidoreductase, partial [Casimicrobiaceae bacterium]|nr:NADH-quinone oxidoreductase [Casimicrobiaceae bacterium]